MTFVQTPALMLVLTLQPCFRETLTLSHGTCAAPPQPSWISVMEHAQRRTPGIVCGRTLSTEPGLAVGLYHDVCGTLNGEASANYRAVSQPHHMRSTRTPIFA